MPAQVGYKERLDGLAYPAHVRDGIDGSYLLVCRPNSPFEIRVDTLNNETARAAALALAEQVLGS
jgi:hypothetical protein